MTNEISLQKKSSNTFETAAPSKRQHPRFFVKTRVELERPGIPEGVVARTGNLSWGGAGLLVPLEVLDVDDSVVLRFPWHKGEMLSARAEVAWNQRVDDRRCRSGVRFSNLSIRNEEKLLRVLSALTRTRHHKEQDISAANAVEISYLDREEMLDALKQIRFGRIEVTLFRPVQANERMPLILTGFGNLPTLHLRARVLWQQAICVASENDSKTSRESALFRVKLALDHPSKDRKRVIDTLIGRLGAFSNNVSFAPG